MDHRRKTISLLLCLALLAGSLGVILPRPAAARAERMEPQLRQAALTHPGENLRVIVQKTGQNRAAEAYVGALGGHIVSDLSIINAFAAEIPAEYVADLGRSPAVRWVSLDGPVESAGKGGAGTSGPASPSPVNTYLDTLGVRQVWNMGLKGEGVTVAVIDSGVSALKDFQVDPTKAKPDTRILQRLVFTNGPANNLDIYGHGTHVAGIVGGSGYLSSGRYAGIAPHVNLVSLRISDDTGKSYESDAVNAMQWVLQNKNTYNIRVVNLSINSATESSYHTSPMSAAAEILWFNGIVVVASAGNTNGSGGPKWVNASPAHDPFIITVGASNEMGTTSPTDDAVTTFSAFGTTQDGFVKPDIIAPGKDIVSVLSNSGGWGSQYPERVVEGDYFRLSGTSMAAPMVAGAAALLLQDEPNLTPDQVKFRLLNGSGRTIAGAPGDLTPRGQQRVYPYLNVFAAVTGTSTASANTGQTASQLLWSGSTPVTWSSVAWNSVAWNSVAWNSVAWNSVAWNSVAWNSVAWNQ